jgi:arabinofuranosyltransferase
MDESKTKPSAPQGNQPKETHWLLWLFVMSLCWGILRLNHPEITDDAFITFKYAQNFADGNGFVFNLGQWILGTTTPIFTLFISLGIFLGVHPWTWVIAWDLVWGTMILWRFQQLFRVYGFERWFPLGAFLVILSSLETRPVAGMETGLYMVAIFSCLSGLAKKRPFPIIGAWALLALLLRPDGAILCLTVAIITLKGWKSLDKRSFFWTTLVCSTILVVYYGILYNIFGSIFPHSLQSKSGVSASIPYQATFTAGMVNFFTDHYHGINLIALVGAFTLFKKRKAFPELSLFVALYLAFFVLGKAPDFKWYRTPMAVIFTMMAGPGIGMLISYIPKCPRIYWKTQCLSFIFGLYLIIPQGQTYIYLYMLEAKHWGEIGTNELFFREASEMINTETPEGETTIIATHEVGIIGYFSKHQIYDMEGLVTDHITEKGKPLSKSEELIASDAQWFIHRFFKGPYPIKHRRKYLELKSLGFKEYRRLQSVECPIITIVFQKIPSSVPHS